MDKAQQVRNLFPPFVIRLGFITSIAILAILLFITNTAEKAHSDSDIGYKQESVFANPEVGTVYAAGNSLNKVSTFSFSYEVEKVIPTPTPIVVSSDNEDIWVKLAQCESKQNWSIDSGNGYYGGLQFSLGAWASVGGVGKPSDASKDEQIMRGKMLQQVRGWGPWGSCSKKLGLI